MLFLWDCTMFLLLRSAQLFGSQYADCILWLFPFLFVFLIRLERDYRLYSVHDTWQYFEHNKFQAPLATSSQHVTQEYSDAAVVLHIYTTNFPHVQFEHSKQYKIPNSSFNFAWQKNVCVDGDIQSDLCKFLLLYDVLKYFFFHFFNVILIIAGFATREDLFECVWNFLFILSSVSFAIFFYRIGTYEYDYRLLRLSMALPFVPSQIDTTTSRRQRRRRFYHRSSHTNKMWRCRRRYVKVKNWYFCKRHYFL